MIYIAFKPLKPKLMLKQLLVFYMTSFVFGGAALSLIYFIKPEQAITQNGVYFGNYPLKAVFLGGIVGFIILTVTFKVVKTRITPKDMFLEIEVYFGEKKIETKAMLDTGNLLKEPITNVPVIIIEHVLLYEIIPKSILNNIDKILMGNFEDVPNEVKEEYITKLKFIPFSSIGKTNGMLLGIKADKLIVKNREETNEISKIIIAIYNKSLTKRGEYQGLLGINLI